MTGQEVKILIMQNDVRCWEVADEMGISEATFWRRLRKTVSDEDLAKIKAAIEAIKSRR